MLDLKVVKGKVVSSSNDVALRFDKKHKAVLKAIREIECSDEFRGLHFMPTEWVTKQNKKHPAFNISRDGFAFLAMGFTGSKSAQFKEDYIKAYNLMESAIQDSIQQAPKSMEELNRVSKKIEELKEVGSFHGKGLASYKKTKKKADATFKVALDSAQLTLNIK